MRRLALLGLTLVGCLKEKVPFCENGAFCPEPLVCTERETAPFCGTVAEVEPCLDQADEVACALPGGVKGYCETGLCKVCDENIAACTYDAWVTMQTPTSVDLSAVYVAGPRDVYAAGRGGVVIRWDGRTWTTLPSPEAGDIRALAGTADQLFAAATTAMYRFDGAAWIGEPAAPNAILGIGCTASTCFSVGFRATVGRLDPTWMYVENPLGVTNPPSLNAIWPTAANEAFAVGSAGTTMTWNGTAWTSQTLAGSPILLAVHGDHIVGRAAGGAGTPVWARQGVDRSAQLPTEIKDAAISLRGVWARGARAFAVGDSGKIVAADGDTFTMMPSGTNAVLNAVGGSGTDVFAVGAGGVVLRYRAP